MIFYVKFASIKDDKKMTGKLYFEDTTAYTPLELGKGTKEYTCFFENTPEIDDDEVDAVRNAAQEIKEIAPKTTIAYCSSISEGTGLTYLIFSNSKETEIHELCTDNLPASDDVGSSVWFDELYELNGIENKTKKTKQDSMVISVFPEVGKLYSFGNYYEPINWMVLDIIEGRALLLSEKALELKAYDVNEGIRHGCPWKDSSIRVWLNSEFLNTAFSTEEQDKMCKIMTKEDTEDKVLLLSYNEYQNYLAGNKKHKAVQADQLKARINPWYAQECEWYLMGAYEVAKDGYAFESLMPSGQSLIRPVIWINVE